MNRKMRKVAALCTALMVSSSDGLALARGFGGGRGGGGARGAGGGFAGGGGRGGYGGGGFAGGGGGGSEFRGGGGGGYGGMSHMTSAPSRPAPQRPQGGYGSYSGRNPYSGGGGESGVRSSSGSGSYTTQRGGTINYGGAGVGGQGAGGGAAGRGVYGIQGTTAGGRDYATAGRVGGAVGPGGNAVGGRSSVGAVSGPNGTAVGGSRSGTAVGPEGAMRASERGGVASGPGGVVAGGSRQGVAVGPGGAIAGGSRGGVAAGPGGVVAGGSRYGMAAGAGGAVAGRGYGVAGYRHYGDNIYGAYHQGWVHGCWNGHGSAAWGWGVGAGLGWGLASWGYGSSLYGMGYTPYTNPYYSAPVVAEAGYDYSQPIDTTVAPPDDAVATPAVSSFEAARASFKQGAFDQALQQAGDALARTPNDSDLHEFRATCLFALGRYDDSAAALYGVLSVGPGWDWTTLVGLYPDVETYTGQLRSLEGFCAANPTSASARFVLASQYLTEGHTDAAADILGQVVALKPDDTLSAKLLRQLDPPKDAPAAPPAEAATPIASDSPPPAGAEIAGTWAARPSAGTTIALAIRPGGDFTWNVTQGGRSQQFAGTSTYGSGLLTLARTEGPALVGRVSWKDPAHMTFRIMGDGPDDPGLAFAR